MEDSNLISRFIESAQTLESEKGARGNLIKRTKIRCTGIQQIEVGMDDEMQPVVIPHTDERGAVVALEFRCSCGSATSVTLDYDGTE